MRRLLLVCLIILILSYPCSALAADFTMGISFNRQNDGATCGELWYNGEVLWRLVIMSDGARPVSVGSSKPATTVVIPDVVNGMFMIKVE